MRGEVELARGAAAPAELRDELPPQIADDNLVKSGVGHVKLVPEDRQAGRPFKLARDLEQRFAFEIERQHFAQHRVGHKDRIPMARNGDRGGKARLAGLFPAEPFLARVVQAADDVGAGIGEEQVPGVIQRQAEGLLEGLQATAAAGDPIREPT